MSNQLCESIYHGVEKVCILMADTDKEIEFLDKEFEDFLCKFKNYMCTYSLREKFVVTNWLTKLKNSNATIDERKLRNRFLKHFIKNQELTVNIFQSEPFKTIPVEFFGPLMGLQKFLPWDSRETLYSTEDEKRAYISDLFLDLSDKGSFLAQQPVPRNGSFFILVLRPDEDVICPGK